jgi:hypothetical protein
MSSRAETLAISRLGTVIVLGPFSNGKLLQTSNDLVADIQHGVEDDAENCCGEMRLGKVCSKGACFYSRDFLERQSAVRTQFHETSSTTDHKRVREFQYTHHITNVLSSCAYDELASHQ